MEYFDKEGKPLTMEEWMGLFGDWNYRVIANSCDTTRNKVIVVSTVWLGIPHGYDGKGRPAIFETLIEVDGEEEGMVRYVSAVEAIDGHRAVCLKYQIPFDPIVPTKPFEQLKFEDSKKRWKGILDE